MAHPAARQCLLRLCHIPQAPSRTRLSFSIKNQSLSTTGNPNPYVCLFSSHTPDSRRRPPPSPSGRSCFSAPSRSPARPRQSGSYFRVRAPSYSTSAPLPSTSPESLSVEQYHEIADSFIDWLLEHLQELQEERADIDCEYSAGVLTIAFPPHGTYVLNKQPPNKQIWLSSPVSGPKRYDYVRLSDGTRDWVYLRDGSLLTELLGEELSIEVC